MPEHLDRTALREACRLFGGVRSVARTASLDGANLSKWFRGQPTLSASNEARLLAVLGIPDGIPATGSVHEWTLSNVLGIDIEAGFRLYFPEGADVMGTPWSRPGVANARKLIPGNRPPEIYAITDGAVRAVLRLPTMLLIHRKNMGQTLRWRGGSRQACPLSIDPTMTDWVEGPLSIESFDLAWDGGKIRVCSDEDVLNAMREEGLSPEEAIRRLRRSI